MSVRWPILRARRWWNCPTEDWMHPESAPLTNSVVVTQLWMLLGEMQACCSLNFPFLSKSINFTWNLPISEYQLWNLKLCLELSEPLATLRHPRRRLWVQTSPRAYGLRQAKQRPHGVWLFQFASFPHDLGYSWAVATLRLGLFIPEALLGLLLRRLFLDSVLVCA